MASAWFVFGFSSALHLAPMPAKGASITRRELHALTVVLDVIRHAYLWELTSRCSGSGALKARNRDLCRCAFSHLHKGTSRS